MRFSEIAARLTGFNIPLFGVQWTPFKQHEYVMAVVDRLAAVGGDPNVSTVSKAAGVSRQFIYTQPLQDSITNAAKMIREAQPVACASPDMTLGLRADRGVLSAKLERWLGSQLGSGTPIDPEAQLRITNERLVADNIALTKRVAQLRRINTILEADLAASRQAHAEDIANVVADPDTSVTALVGR